MKKIYRFLIFIVLTLFTNTAIAYDLKLNDIYYNLNQEEGIATIAYYTSECEEDITIPSTFSYRGEQYTVTEIERRAFDGCSRIVSIVLPNSITVIGEQAFANCSRLVSIVLPNSITEIRKNTFRNCQSLVSIDWPDSLTKIGDYAFLNCYNLVLTELPDSLTEIGNSAFMFCNLLINKLPDSLKIIGIGAFAYSLKNESIFIPASLESIGRAAFHSEDLAEINVSPDNPYYASEDGILYNKDLTILLFCPQGKSGIVTVPDSVEEIYGYKYSDSNGDELGAFSECKKITSVILGKNVKSIGYHGFSYCANLSEVIFNDNLVNIANYAFYNCSSLTSIILPDSLTTVGEGVFDDCKKLSSVKLSEGLTYVGESMFYDCSNLSTIIIPKNVELICEYAFKYCSSLKVVVCLNPIPPRVISDAFTGVSIREAELQVPAYVLEDYKNAAVWKNFGTITPLDIEETLPQSIVISGIPDRPIRPSESIQLSAQVLPEDAFSQSVVWSSSKTSVASITQDGFVIAISEGSTTITVYVEDYPEISASCVITVSNHDLEIEAEEILLNTTSESLQVGETVQLVATVLPEDASNNTLIWESSDASIAEVDANGLVTAIDEGEATITVICGDCFAICYVNVGKSTGIKTLNLNNRISIYTIDGILLKKDCKTEDLKSLPKGMYIIVYGNQRYKISI